MIRARLHSTLCGARLGLPRGTSSLGKVAPLPYDVSHFIFLQAVLALNGSHDETSLTMTLIQFDSENPHEVVFSGRAIESVPPLTSSTFQPRSATPLYDALGRTISMAEKTHVTNERIVVVTFSDGLENASKEHSRKSVFDRITTLRDAGWTFVFLGANQDSYNEGGGMGFNAANTQNFAFDREGTQRACQDVSTATKSMRYNVKKESRLSGKWYDNEDFFEGSKSAEADYTSRRTSMLP